MSIVFLFIFIFLSRVLFLSISPAFYDSLEYIRLFENTNLFDSLKQVHLPIHPLWIFVGWLFNKIPISTTLYKIEFLNAVLGTLSCCLIYKIFKQLVGEKKALILTLFSCFLPYFWLSQINILYEPLLGVLLLGSFWFLIKGFEGDRGNKGEKGNPTSSGSAGLRGARRGNWGKVVLAGLLFAGAFLVSSTAVFYLIFFAGVFLGPPSSSQTRLRRVKILGGLGILVGLLGYLGILRLRGIPAGEILSVLSAGNNLLTKISTEGIMLFVRGIRNSLVVYFNYLTVPLGIMLGVLGMLGVLRDKRYRIPVISWLVCFFFLNTIWHAGMFGRLSLLLTVVPIFLLAKVSNKLLLLLFIYIAVSSGFKVMPYAFQKVPNILEKEYIEKQKEDFLLIISNYEEPYLRGNFEVLVLNSPTTDLEKIKGKLEESIKESRIVLMTSQALTTPYFQYDGMNYQLLSKKRIHATTQGQMLVKNYKLDPLIGWPGMEIQIFKLNSQKWYTFLQKY